MKGVDAEEKRRTQARRAMRDVEAAARARVDEKSSKQAIPYLGQGRRLRSPYGGKKRKI